MPVLPCGLSRKGEPRCLEPAPPARTRSGSRSNGPWLQALCCGTLRGASDHRRRPSPDTEPTSQPPSREIPRHRRWRAPAPYSDVQTARNRAERLYSATESILDGALEDSDGRTALNAIKSAVDVMREARGYLELRGQFRFPSIYRGARLYARPRRSRMV